MRHQTKIIDSFCFVTDYVANGSFASLKQGVTYRNKPDYAILVRVTDFTKKWNGNYVWVDKKSYDFLNKSSLKEGDLIIANVGETGKCFIVPNLGQPMTLGPNSILVRPQPETCNTKYLYYYFSSEVGRAEIEKISSATTQSKFNKTSFRKLEIPLPPLHIQEQIADTLDKADSILRKDQELLQKYDELAQAIFYDMFGDPVRNERGWKKTTLGETCYMIKDGPHVSPQYVEKGVPFISVNNIIKGDWDLSKVKYISEEDHLIFKKRCNPTNGDVLYTKGGTTGFAKYVDVEWKFTNWVHIAVLKFDRNIISGRFLEYMLNTEHCYRQSQKYTRGIANRDLVLGEMKKIELFIPPISIQNSFAVLVEKILLQKSNLKKTLDVSHYLNNAYLKKYFS
jgi:type I restriction enzyme S subunit